MSTSKEYMQFVLDQLEGFPDVTYRKMFGEYMVYLQGRPVLLVCDNCAMVKKLPELAELMRGASDGLPYDCLLYTSPSPRDGLLSRMPSSA